MLHTYTTYIHILTIKIKNEIYKNNNKRNKSKSSFLINITRNNKNNSNLLLPHLFIANVYLACWWCDVIESDRQNLLNNFLVKTFYLIFHLPFIIVFGHLYLIFFAFL